MKVGRIVLIGAGAASIALHKYLKVAGANLRNVVVVDSKGVIHPRREDIEEIRKTNP